MVGRTPLRLALAVLLAPAVLLATSIPGMAVAETKNFSGLADKGLSLESNAGDLLLNAAMGGACQGTLGKLQITMDTETQLKATLSYTGYDGCVLTARLADGKRNGIAGFQPVVQTLSSAGSVDLLFTIDPARYAADQEVRAPKLYVTIGQQEKATRFYRASYNLNKRFKIVNPVSDVTATPMGSAAALPKTAQAPPPEAAPLPKLKIYPTLQKAPTVSEAVSTRSLYLKAVDDPAKLNVVGSAATAQTVRIATPKAATSAAPAPATTRTMETRRILMPNAVLQTPTAPPPTQTPPAQTPPAQTPPAPKTTPEGPDDKALPLFESLVTDYDFAYPFQITNIRLDVYPDKNKNAGVYYFLPSAYNLLCDSERGIQFVIDYGTSSEDTSSSVRMSGKLTAGIGKKEIDVVKELVQAYVSANSQLGYPTDPKRCELRALPIAAPPTVNFDTDLKQYSITNQTVNATSLTEPVDVSWRTDQANATDISNSLKANVGIIGTMTLKPQGGTLGDQTIPVRIRLADERTLGRFTLTTGWRGRNWTNTTPYPIKLKNLHALWVNKKTPAVYTWTLGDREIPPGMFAHFLADAVPQWLDAEPNARMWLDYEVESCEPCHDAVIRNVIHSTVQAQSQLIKFKLLSFFQEFKLNSMVINVRTKQADPAGDAIQALTPIEVGQDAKDYLSSKIYVPRGESPSFEFQIQLILEDGSLRQSAWLPRTDLIVPIGKSQIKELFPQLATP